MRPRTTRRTWRGLIEEKTLLIGHSLGARNALVAGARYPEKVAAVVAIDFTPYIEREVFDALGCTGGWRKPRLRLSREVSSYLKQRYPRLPADAIERRARHGYECVDGKWRPLASPAAMRETCAGLREDLAPILKSIGVPVLLLRGAGQQAGVARSLGEDAGAAAGSRRRTRSPAPTTTCLKSSPRAVAAAVLDFWDSIQ